MIKLLQIYFRIRMVIYAQITSYQITNRILVLNPIMIHDDCSWSNPSHQIQRAITIIIGHREPSWIIHCTTYILVTTIIAIVICNYSKTDSSLIQHVHHHYHHPHPSIFLHQASITIYHHNLRSDPLIFDNEIIDISMSLQTTTVDDGQSERSAFIVARSQSPKITNNRHFLIFGLSIIKFLNYKIWKQWTIYHIYIYLLLYYINISYLSRLFNEIKWIILNYSHLIIVKNTLHTQITDSKKRSTIICSSLCQGSQHVALQKVTSACSSHYHRLSRKRPSPGQRAPQRTSPPASCGFTTDSQLVFFTMTVTPDMKHKRN